MKRLLIAGVLVISGCALPTDGDGPPRRDQPTTVVNRTPQPEARSAYGNPRFYDVYGKRYYVKQSAQGYRERGVASWYGKKFHGRRTSSGEPYDMHALSAAHKTLPLPTWVRVTNLTTGKSLVLRVNDRGPFVDNRIIDLSYAAARELDLIANGTGLVEVEAIDFSRNNAPIQAAAPQGNDADVDAGTLYMQTGAFSDRGNAARQLGLLQQSGISNAFVSAGGNGSAPVYRVRIGPIADVGVFDRLVARLAAIGVHGPRLVSDESIGTR